MENIKSDDIIIFINNSIKTLEKRYNVKVNFTDVVGSFITNPSLDNTLSKLDFHDNPFCNKIKLNQNCLIKCIKGKDKIKKKCLLTKKEFFGVCHMGIGEYIFPIFHKEILLAFLCVGEFKSNIFDEKITLYDETINNQNTIDLYNSNTCLKEAINIDDMIHDFNSLCYLFSYLYANFTSYNYKIYDNQLINKAINYINSNYHENINLNIIAEYCFCNKNYLSALFFKTTNKHLNDYISEIRINNSIHLMRTTNLPIVEIALRNGFNDASYFSTVFKKHLNCSPSEYKMKILNKNA